MDEVEGLVLSIRHIWSSSTTDRGSWRVASPTTRRLADRAGWSSGMPGRRSWTLDLDRTRSLAAWNVGGSAPRFTPAGDLRSSALKGIDSMHVVATVKTSFGRYAALDDVIDREDPARLLPRCRMIEVTEEVDMEALDEGWH